LVETVKSKRMPCFAPKIPNFCMTLYSNILNIFINNDDFKLQTEIKLKILEQIQYLNF
jgi:hypothetical protein